MINNSPQPISQEFFYSRDGYQVDFYGDRWILSKDINLPIGELCSIFPGDSFVLRRVLEFYAKNTSPSHTSNLMSRAAHYVKGLSGAQLFSVESLISYRESLDKTTEWYVSTLRVLILQWSRLGYPGISPECLSLLDEWVLKGNEKGFAVQSMCPEEGPLTDIEMQGVIGAVTDAFAAKMLSLEKTAIALTLSMTGRRSTQISGLKIKDLISLGDGKYWINFPRAKQRGKGWREEFKTFPIVEDLWLVLQQQASSSQASISKVLGAERFREIPVGELPLFPNLSRIKADTQDWEFFESDITHLRAGSVNKKMAEVSKVLCVASERTGSSMNLNPTRFRYTLGTNLAREGRGVSVIAEALDHSDTQNAGVYVRNNPDIVERIDKAVALQLAPLAQAFRGVLVESERDARRGNDPSSRLPGVGGRGNVGTCGSFGWCGALPPLVCYTCTHFQPWLDGPHEEVLDQLLGDRDRVSANTGDLKIASINDRLILAVSEVVTKCKAGKGDA